MAKWTAIVLIMMVVIAFAVTVEAYDYKKFTECIRKCAKPCKPHDGNCVERCKIKCGGPNPPHGPGPFPPPSSPRTLHEMSYEEVRGRKER
ncbi:hypothetical protein Bca52824_034924 [Brassica carinata]|uniref:Transmembrane protein n=1 Tax=Brassica carinata TaxID=52824 RepID=A0A8X7S2P8_BRACI|nr:hypothetical protein Bca52824_034923 [Brassica carinata]KAG2298452.1 hypothetical protein Bca52824_034924 [Brassica carinata]